MKASMRAAALGMILIGAYSLSTLANAADVADASTPSTSTRYVWATSLLLRAEPDSKSVQLAKIPYGTALDLSSGDAPVRHTEVFAKYVVNEKATTVTMNSAWQKVHWQDKDGWVFDGYLSRYPTPDTSTFEAARKDFENYASDEMLYADHLFGPGKRKEWNMRLDGIKSSAFQAAQKYMHSISQQFNTYYVNSNSKWINIEWSDGANCNYYMEADEGWDENLRLKNLPLTFNEALLWQMHFHNINANGYAQNASFSKFKYVPGKSLVIEFSDGSLYGTAINCNDKSCDLSSEETS